MTLTTVDDVAAMLRWGAAEKTRHQDQLEGYVAAAESVVEDEIGPVVRRTVVHVADGGPAVLLPYRAHSVESVTVSGVAVDEFTVDLAAGIVYGPFTCGRQNVTVTFTVGLVAPNADPTLPPTDLPEAIGLAAAMIAADKWAIASQRAPGLDEQVDPVYLTPRAVRDLLSSWQGRKVAGFA